MLSLLCSEWEKVEHIQLDHRETTDNNFYFRNQLFEIEILPLIEMGKNITLLVLLG